MNATTIHECDEYDAPTLWVVPTECPCCGAEVFTERDPEVRVRTFWTCQNIECGANGAVDG